VFALPLSENAELRPLQPWQAEEFLAHIDRGRASIDPWIPWASVSTDLPSARATLQRYADNTAKDAAFIYGIWLEGTLVGGVMFVSFDAASGIGEIGCWTEPAGAGQGLITLAARRLIAWGFEQRGLSRIEWRTITSNLRSSNVARRLGMKLDGVLRSAYLHNGVRHDKEVWSLLAEDWRPER
jgi:ribosomal-protein-serine acetyltransferase